MAHIKDGTPGSLGEHLISKGLLSSELVEHLDALLAASRSERGGDIEASLSSLVDDCSRETIVVDLVEWGAPTIDFSTQTKEDADGTIQQETGSHTSHGSLESSKRFSQLSEHMPGGMGAVFTATDTQLNRRVAVKMLHDKYAKRSEYRDRFMFEGLITGNLEHPGIVPVYAMGEDDQSLPFYAMRFIQGRTLGDATRDFHRSGKGFHSDEFKSLLGRFASVCAAIHYAHSKQVLHRDLKPANIMLGDYQETLVVDWGLAAKMDAREIPAEDDETVDQSSLSADLRRRDETMAGSIIGTPSYMSPEQALGNTELFGPVTDVFNLGATLFHTLTGEAPFRGADTQSKLDCASRCEMLSPRAINPAIPRTLEAITLKAMAEAPQDRYESADALRKDINRWVTGGRVLEAPDSMADWMVRWARRHTRWAAALAGLLLLVSVGALVAVLVVNQARGKAKALASENSQLADEKELARQEAEQRFLQAREAVDVWLTGFSEASRFVPSAQGLRRDLLLRAAEEYERFAQDELKSVGQSGELQLERGRTLLRLGEVYRELGANEQAIAAMEKARDIFKALTASDMGNMAARLSHASSHNRLAMAFLAMGKSDDALQSVEQCIAITQEVEDADPASQVATELGGAALSNRGQIQLRRSSPDRISTAEKSFEQAAQKFAKLRQLAPDNVAYQAQSARTLLGLGLLASESGDSTKALQHYSQAATFSENAVSTNPNNLAYEQLLSECQMYVASAANATGRNARAIDAYRAVVASSEKLARAYPQSPVYRENSAIAKYTLGQLLIERGEAQDAIATLRSSQQEFSDLLGLEHALPRYQAGWGVATDNLALALLINGDAADARKQAKQAAEAFAKLSQQSPQTSGYQTRQAVARSHLGQALMRLDEPQAAATEFQTARELLQQGLEESDEKVARHYTLAILNSRWGDALWVKGEPQAAETQWREAADQFRLLAKESSDPQHHNDIAWFFVSCPIESLRDTALALESASTATDASPRNPRYLCTRAYWWLRKSEYNKAMEMLIQARSLAGDETSRIDLLQALSAHGQGDSGQAQKHYEQGAKSFQQHAPGDWDLARLAAVCEAAIEQSNETAAGQDQADE